MSTETAELAPPSKTAQPPRRFRWLRAGETAPTVPRRRPLVRILIALTSGTALLAVVGVVAAAAVIPPIGARRSARAAAESEVGAQLAADERIVASVFASQRRWTDMFRESYGIVVATNRRVLYVGAPPMPLLRPREDGPRRATGRELPVRRGVLPLEPTTLYRGLVKALDLRTPDAHADFIIDDGAWANALAVSRSSAEARRAVTRDDQAFEESYRSPLPQAAVYITHIVQRGETLTGLARRYQTSPDVLRQLNQLRTDDIRSGQRLRVPQVDDTP